ncbi:MAG: DUF58 domain-containing protein [Lewinellaceae bacterium]|nr:DUF58 domain-containing protein [Lewinellaceae bacterium]
MLIRRKIKCCQMLKTLYLSNRFFTALGLLAALFALGFPYPPLFLAAQGAFVLFLALLLVDAFVLFNRGMDIKIRRRLPKVFGLGDDNPVRIELTNRSSVPVWLTVIDELPVQFQIRDFERKLTLKPGEVNHLHYELRPLTRGEYVFGSVRVFVATVLGLLQRRISEDFPMKAPVYPSILQMKQYELRAFNQVSLQKGIKKMRRIGHSYEFEQIKNYVRGDDYRSINWKASSRRASLMVNQYEDERAQQIYCLIDKSRVMRMPFEGLSLMDYAINSCLVISNIALKKHDRAGLITFSDIVGSTVKADSRPTQLNTLLTALYNEQERPVEANYEILYHAARKLVNGRSLLLLYTNFESMYALDRVLPILRRINNLHLLVVVFFENTEIRSFADMPAATVEGIYQQTIARKYLSEKSQMVQKLYQFGIQAILTRPQDLSINTINKYLELKARGLI